MISFILLTDKLLVRYRARERRVTSLWHSKLKLWKYMMKV
jgi:hypothetical protein